MKMGIIAEDDSDVAVVRELTLTLLRPRRIGFKRFVGNGCGKLRRKCGAWAANLVRQGCPWISVVHDLDQNNEEQLRHRLVASLADVAAEATIVLIPKREIEAWLLFDANAIASAFHERRRLRLPGNPEGLNDPKRFLGDLIRRVYRRDYLNTVHNEAIAKAVDIACLRRCRSFSAHPEFVAKIRKKLR
jgi:hypothetical protein